MGGVYHLRYAVTMRGRYVRSRVPFFSTHYEGVVGTGACCIDKAARLTGPPTYPKTAFFCVAFIHKPHKRDLCDTP